MNYILLKEKVRIHSQIGRTCPAQTDPRTFYESKGNICELEFGDTYVMPIILMKTNFLDAKRALFFFNCREKNDK
jgi:hypothetical protein